MNTNLFAEQPSAFAPAGLLVLARIANIVVGLGMIPLLIHSLGGNGFAAWALLLASGAAFSVLEVGMPLTFVKHAAPWLQQGNWAQVHKLLLHVAMIVALAFLLATPVLLWFAASAARQLQLPDGDWLSARQMLLFVFAAVGLRALLQFGVHTLNAARRFRALAAASFMQSFTANVAATVVAMWSGRLDYTLVAFWLGQLLVMAATLVIVRRLYIGALGFALPKLGLLRALLGHGLKVQMGDWAQIINFQFDKFLIVSTLGLWSVAPYEVANRGVLALRSIPASGLDSFLASAAINQESGADRWPRYQAVTQMAAAAVLVFMIAPLAIAPIFMCAWTGEMGYSARWVFVFVMLGGASGLLAVPAAALAQAAGRADLQARAAIASMVVNIPLSIGLVWHWQMAGAAAGSAIAMLVGSALLLSAVHRLFGQSLAATLRSLWQFWPLLVVCLVCAGLVYYPFDYWLLSLDAGTRYSRETRSVLVLVAGATYLACLAAMAAVQIRRGALSRDQYDFLAKWIRIKWFVAYCDTKLNGLR
jgi:O-antigen/teichoic acid export membrane protein